MTIWIVFALMTVAATLAVLVPMARAARSPATDGHDVAVYRDQLAEIERDVARGVLAEGEAVAARAEIGRRLIRADEAADGDAARVSGKGRLATAARVGIILFVPLTALAGYVALGSPDIPDQPLASRECGPEAGVDNLVVCVERHLASNPADAEGWKVLAPIYLRLGRADDAADAYARVIEISGETPARLTDYAAALMAASGGIVSRPAMAALEKAMAADLDDMRARFLYASGLVREGRSDDAIAVYDDILARSAKDAPWIATVTEARRVVSGEAAPQALAPGPRLGMAPDVGSGAGSGPAQGPLLGAAPGPSPDQMANAAAMNPAERQAMIEGMVARLADRLAQDPKDLPGWLRLIRAYGVMGAADKARDAAGSARSAFAGETAALAEIEAALGEATGS
ncbi:c-type cytochrome biogenesis protein CcmI [Methylobrevis pamukkalensis]|uniref:Formate-dependent nitrite reductase complex subunit NrfG n=1 Tax=Methylobrevis pamukkalensis TaxID=1439726 RepID=A0A1E3H2K7_9HYPH|nr:c-type cytochrome biogenesis protein CcmI [Methylobrevis pamukkalensis]ODN70559.1 formate-dependent nitrite reductase complex subunit NrfG [Methylobrevis pamukkalensis]